MTVAPVSKTTTTNQTTGTRSVTNDQFLKLFLTQLQNQNPLEPMQDKDFLLQLAQFTQVENSEKMTQILQKLRSLMSATQAAALLGKQVIALREGDTSPIEGTVTAVRFTSSGVWLKVGNSEVLVDNVLQVNG